MQQIRDTVEWARDLEAKGDLAGAADVLSQAVELKPDYGAAWFALGALREKLADRNGAILAFEHAKASPLAREFTRWHQEKFKEWPNYESDHGYFTIVAYKAAVERAAKAAGGKWPTQDAVIQGLEGVEAERRDGGGLGVAVDAEHAALLAERVAFQVVLQFDAEI